MVNDRCTPIKVHPDGACKKWELGYGLYKRERLPLALDAHGMPLIAMITQGMVADWKGCCIDGGFYNRASVGRARYPLGRVNRIALWRVVKDRLFNIRNNGRQVFWVKPVNFFIFFKPGSLSFCISSRISLY